VLFRSVSGEVAHGSELTIQGSGFSSASLNGIIFDDLEDGNCDLSATEGSWQSKGDLLISSIRNRHPFSAYNASVNFDNETWACFKGGSDAPKWYAQYWFFLEDDLDFSSNINNNLGNIKIFRMWTTGSGSNNLRLQLLSSWESDLVVEQVDQGHNWQPVVPGTDSIDQIMGRSAPGWIDPGGLGWRDYDSDLTRGTWHLFQFEYKESSVNNFDGEMRWWFDGKLILDVNDVRTRTSAHPSSMRPNTVGWYNSHGAGADGNDHFYLDDAYVSNTWARVEIGNSPDYANCTKREIQLPVSWNASDIRVRMNQGSFVAGETAYVFVTNEQGSVSDGRAIVIGGTGPAGPGMPGQPIANQ